jgi:hypothetical protein
MLAAAPDMSAGHLTLSRYASDRRNIGTIIVGASPGSRPHLTNKITRRRAPRRGRWTAISPFKVLTTTQQGRPLRRAEEAPHTVQPGRVRQHFVPPLPHSA